MSLPSGDILPSSEDFLADPIPYLMVLLESLTNEGYSPIWRLRGSTTVPAAAVTVNVLVDIDRLPAEVFVTPSWLTTVAVTAKSTTGFTVVFGTGPVGDAPIDWLVIVSEAGP